MESTPRSWTAVGPPPPGFFLGGAAGVGVWNVQRFPGSCDLWWTYRRTQEEFWPPAFDQNGVMEPLELGEPERSLVLQKQDVGAAAAPGLLVEFF